MSQSNLLCVGRLLFLGQDSIYPGWYLQYYLRGRLKSERLEISDRADAYEAVSEAAGFLGCATEHIQIEGDNSSERLFAM